MSTDPEPRCRCTHVRICHETNYGLGPCWKLPCPCDGFVPELRLLELWQGEEPGGAVDQAEDV